MKKYLIGYLLFTSLFTNAQIPLTKMWDYRFGGTNQDILTCFRQTRDGGYILGGYSASDIGGDKTQASRGSYDYWIVKINDLGIKQWDREFGGIGNDRLYSIQQTIDGGYILGGYSDSGSGADKTQGTWGGVDYWIIKTDSLGNKLWDLDFGGSENDQLQCGSLSGNVSRYTCAIT